jgi:hypothetical protein
MMSDVFCNTMAELTSDSGCTRGTLTAGDACYGIDFTAGLFSQNPALTLLSIECNDFSPTVTIESGLFEGLPQLTYLKFQLAFNTSEEFAVDLPGDVLHPLKNLEVLTIEGNFANREIPVDFFKGLNKVEALDAGYKGAKFSDFPNVKSLPKGIFDYLPSLSSVSGVFTAVETLPSGLFAKNKLLQSVEGVSLVYLKEWPSNMFGNNPSLNYLDFNGPQIVDGIPPTGGLFFDFYEFRERKQPALDTFTLEYLPHCQYHPDFPGDINKAVPMYGGPFPTGPFPMGYREADEKIGAWACQALNWVEYIDDTAGVLVQLRTPSGTCKRRCGTIGWGRTFGYKAEEDEDAGALDENDKFYMMPFGFGMGWGMMMPPMGFGAPAPWMRPPPFFPFWNPFAAFAHGPPTPGFYAPPNNQQEANNNVCMNGFQGNCRCSCDIACLTNGDCCYDWRTQCWDYPNLIL